MNPADINTVQGTYGTLPTPDPSNPLGTASPSLVPGGEGVFEVVSAGSGVSGELARKGTWVLPAGKKGPLGTWRTHMLASADDVFAIDKTDLTPVQAATATVNPVTAYRLLRTIVGDDPFRDMDGTSGGLGTVLREGDWFVQNAANGGVGRAVLQLAREWGLRSVSVVRTRPDDGEATERLKSELVRLGGGPDQAVVVTEDELLAKTWPEQLASITRGAPVRLGLNAVGGRSGTCLARSLSPGGSTLVTYGGMSKQAMPVGAGALIFNDVRFVGFWLSRWAARHPEAKRKVTISLLEMMRKGKLETGPVEEVKWEWETDGKLLVNAAQKGLDGYKQGKTVFVFGKT